MSLKDKIDAAANRLSLNITDFVGGDWHDDDINGIASDIAKAMTNIAREAATEMAICLMDEPGGLRAKVRVEVLGYIGLGEEAGDQ